MLLNESYFIKTAELIQNQVKVKLINNTVDSKFLFDGIEKNIKEYEELSKVNVVDKNK